MQDDGNVKRFGERRYLTDAENAAASTTVWLKNVIGPVEQALFVVFEIRVAFSAGDQNVHHRREPGRRFVIVAMEWFFEPVGSRFLKSAGHFETSFEIPDLLSGGRDRNLCSAIEHDVEVRTSGLFDEATDFHIIHRV